MPPPWTGTVPLPQAASWSGDMLPPSASWSGSGSSLREWPGIMPPLLGRWSVFVTIFPRGWNTSSLARDSFWSPPSASRSGSPSLRWWLWLQSGEVHVSVLIRKVVLLPCWTVDTVKQILPRNVFKLLLPGTLLCLGIILHFFDNLKTKNKKKPYPFPHPPPPSNLKTSYQNKFLFFAKAYEIHQIIMYWYWKKIISSQLSTLKI